MATADPMTKVQEILKCVICWERFKDPRQLKCEHVFCFECINTHFRTHGKNCAPCPVCRSLYWPDKRDANNLSRSSFPLRQLVDIQQIQDRVCEATGCTQDRAIFLCLTCRQWLCDACKSQTCNDTNTAHDAHITTEIIPGLIDIVKRSRHKRCCKHPTHDVEWYCPQCRMLVCELCKANSHLHHKLVDVTEHSRDTRDSMKRTAASLQEKQQQHRRVLELCPRLQNAVNAELFTDKDCQKMNEMCSMCLRDIDNCERIVLLIAQLLMFGSDVAIIDTYRNLDERIETEFGQCHSLEPLLTRLTSRKSDNNDARTTRVGAYRSDHRGYKLLYNAIKKSTNHSCASHPNHEVTLFCTQCNLTVCTTCRVDSHLDHVVTDISDKCRVCFTTLKRFNEKLQKQVRDYKTTRCKFLDMQQAPCAEALNPSYYEAYIIRCESGIDTCQDFIKIITFLLQNGIPPIVLDMFLELKCRIEEELKACPSDFATPLRQLACFISDTWDPLDICVDDTYCGDAETRNAGNEAAGGMTVTSQGIERNTSSNTVVANGPEISTSDTLVVDGREGNNPGRHTIVTHARNVVSEIPNNPNASEEGNARGLM